MTVKLTIDIASIGIEAAPGDVVVISSPVIRESPSRPGALVSTAPFVVQLSGGRATVDVEPGPVVVSLRCRNILDSALVETVIPEHDCTLADVLREKLTFTQPAETRVYKAINDFQTRLSGVTQLVSQAESAANEANAASQTVDGIVKMNVDAGAALVREEVKAEVDRVAAALSTKADLTHIHTIGQVTDLQTALDGKASLVGGLVPTSQMPAVALTKPQVVPDRAGMLALTAQEGDVAVITAGTDKGTYMLGTGSPSVFSSWVALAAPTDAVTSVNGQTGVVNLSASNVGAAPSSHTHTSAQVSDATSSPTASVVMKRDANGRAQVADPSAAADAATKKYVDDRIATRLAPASSPGIVYGTDGSGNQGTYSVKNAAVEWSLAQRGVSGTIKVGDPIVAPDAATKGYVDTGLNGKASATHSHTLDTISPRTVYPSGESPNSVVCTGSTGWFNLRADPTNADHPTRKAYVDARTPQIKVVTALPSSPDSSVVYIVTG